MNGFDLSDERGDVPTPEDVLDAALEAFFAVQRPPSTDREAIVEYEMALQRLRVAYGVRAGTVEPCPVRSSITDQSCPLPAGHPQDSATRFHRYANAVQVRTLNERNAQIAALREALEYVNEQVGGEYGGPTFLLMEPTPGLDAGDQDPGQRAVIRIRRVLTNLPQAAQEHDERIRAEERAALVLRIDKRLSNVEPVGGMTDAEYEAWFSGIQCRPRPTRRAAAAAYLASDDAEKEFAEAIWRRDKEDGLLSDQRRHVQEGRHAEARQLLDALLEGRKK